MIAKLKENKSIEGFTPNKLYKYYDTYNIEKGELKFYFLSDDNNKRRIMNEREFTKYFHGDYNSVYENE